MIDTLLGMENIKTPEIIKALIVEDNELNAILAEKVLRDWNWKVEVAGDGFIALDKIKHKDFDVVLMDIQLPGIDGYETTRKIRNEMEAPKNAITIIAMTAHALMGEEEKCLEAGMDGYVSKPFDPEKLYLKIVTALHINSSLNRRKNSIPNQDKLPESETIRIADETIRRRHTDLTYLRGLAKGSDTFIIQMLNIFITQTPHALERMENALKNKDWKLLRQVVHKIKPSIMFVGLSEIVKEVPLLEDYAAEEIQLDKIPALVNKIKRVCTESLEELHEELERLKLNKV